MYTINELIEIIQNARSYDSVREELAELAELTGYGDVWDYDNLETFVRCIRKMENQLHCDLCPRDEADQEEHLTVHLYYQEDFSSDEEPKKVLTVSGFDSAHKISPKEKCDPEYKPGDIELLGSDGDILAILTFVH